MTEMDYKGYIIEATPFQVRDENKCTCGVVIFKYRANSVSERPFSSSTTFSSQQEAITQCLNFGKLIIDGKIKNCTVDDL
jgi:hypothetical protein